jgi:P4 family phage/plasmid primase-like protien
MTFQVGSYLPDLAPIPYIPYDPADPVQLEIDDFFLKVFPRPDLREWMDKRLLPSCLEGKNREQCYFTFKGVGGNGKSKLVDLMTFAMGDYQTSLQSTALTRKRPESGAANPDIMSIKNKRFIYMQEPDDRESLNTSRMKQFSGEDAVEARGLFQDQERFKVTGKLFMMCNEFPPINSMDRGTWRRIRVVPFESKFVKPGDKEIGQPNVYLQDMMLDAKLKRWRVAFFSRMVHNYVTYYAASGLEPMPPCVMESSNRYKEDFDVFAKFVQARIRKDNDAEKPVTMAEIWRAYRYWVEGGGGTGKKLTQNELTNRCHAEYGEPRNKKWLNLILFDSDDKVEEYDDRKRLETAAREAKAKEAMAAAGFDEDEDVEESV